MLVKSERKDRMKEWLHRSPLGIVAIISVATFVAELASMAILKIFPTMEVTASFLLDSTLLVLFLVPILRYIALKPLQELVRRREMAEQDLRVHQNNLKRKIEERTERLTEAVANLRNEISARQETEAALQKSEERFRQLFEQSDDAIILFKSGTCNVLDTNPVAEKMYGYTARSSSNMGQPVSLIRTRSKNSVQ